MLQREGPDSKVAAIFYRAVVQAVLLFSSDAWVLLAAMERTAEGTQSGFLQQIRGKRARRRADRTWFTTAAEEVREAAGTQSVTTYIGRRQGTVVQWVALRPVFEV